MARIRTIKPEFFDDPDLAKVSFVARLCFIGLWTQADREGRLTADCQRLKVRLFPYDDVQIEPLLSELAAREMIVRYLKGAQGYIWIPKFTKHQRPHPKEPASIIPAPPRSVVRKNGSTRKDTASKPESGSLDTGVLILESGKRTRAAASPPPAENLSVITKLAHLSIDVLGLSSLAELADDVKARCAEHGIAYDADVTRKAIDSAIAQKAAARRSA